jgi:hypothetical protein
MANRHEALAEQFHAMYPLPGRVVCSNAREGCFDTASAVVSAPVPPECPTQILRCAHALGIPDTVNFARLAPRIIPLISHLRNQLRLGTLPNGARGLGPFLDALAFAAFC